MCAAPTGRRTNAFLHLAVRKPFFGGQAKLEKTTLCLFSALGSVPQVSQPRTLDGESASSGVTRTDLFLGRVDMHWSL